MKRALAVLVGMLTLSLTPTFGATVSDVSNGLNTFVNNATSSLPFAASAGLDWSDAYIGSIVGVPPHFGIGLETGLTTIPGKNLSPLVSALGSSLPFNDVPLPLAAINARIGGFLLPFDIGLKVGTIPGGLTLNNYNITYQNFGFDVRYALFQGEPLLPDFSVGGGVDYFSSEITTPSLASASYTDSNSNTLTVSNPKAVLDISAVTFEAKAQISKSLLILTPYLGVAGLVGSSTAKATVNANVSATNSLSSWSLPNLSSGGFNQSNSAAAFGLKVYGGTSINILLVKLDLQGMYSILDGAYGGSLGFRFQL